MKTTIATTAPNTKNWNRTARNLKEVNRAIQAHFPMIELVRGNGYYYISAVQPETPTAAHEANGLLLAAMYTTSIPCNSLNQQSILQWVNDVHNLISNHAWEDELPQAKPYIRRFDTVEQLEKALHRLAGQTQFIPFQIDYDIRRLIFLTDNPDTLQRYLN